VKTSQCLGCDCGATQGGWVAGVNADTFAARYDNARNQTLLRAFGMTNYCSPLCERRETEYDC